MNMDFGRKQGRKHGAPDSLSVFWTKRSSAQETGSFRSPSERTLGAGLQRRSSQSAPMLATHTGDAAAAAAETVLSENMCCTLSCQQQYTPDLSFRKGVQCTARASRSLGLRNEALTKPNDDDSCEASDSETGLKTKNQVADQAESNSRLSTACGGNLTDDLC
ncbi:unnamed protein product [Leuciscus chuanchicus]